MKVDLSIMLSGRVEVHIIDEKNVQFTPDLRFEIATHPRLLGLRTSQEMLAAYDKVKDQVTYLLLLAATQRAEEKAGQGAQLVATVRLDEKAEKDEDLN